MGNGPLERELKFEKKNTNLVKIPKHAKVEKRPIPHPPVASPYANASSPKIIYVSTGTPFMSAVKRTQKLLLQAEKRAMANISLEDTRKTEQQKLAELAKASENKEEIFIKATGRAIEKVLKVGKWFKEKDSEYSVRVKTGSVLVVDDIVEDEELKEKELEKQKSQEEEEEQGSATTSGNQDKGKQKSKDKKRKREVPADEDAETPETRTRWIKMVEVAVSLK